MKRVLPVLIVLLVGLLTVKPLFSPGFFPMHDDTQVARVIEMGKSLSEGQFPVRWVGTLGYGYGYPIYNFYGPLPYYVGGILYALDIPALIATKVMFAIGMVLPALVIFFVIRGFTGWQAGLLASVLYTLAPYRAVQMYVRGSVGEYWVLIFWPLILSAFVKLAKSGNQTSQIIVGAIGVSGAILSHTLLGYVTVFFIAFGLGVYWLLRVWRHRFDVRTALGHVAAYLLGLAMSAFFWMPAFVEMGYTNVAGQVSATAHYPDHFICFGQLWSSLWGFGGSQAGCIDGMSFMIGKAHILASFLGIAGLVVSWRTNARIWGILGALLIAIGIFFATPISLRAWQALPGFPYLQYPWRFLNSVVLGVALLGSLGVLVFRKSKERSFMVFLVVAVLVFLNIKWFRPQYTYQKSSIDFASYTDIAWRVSKISDEYLPKEIVRPQRAAEVIVSGTISPSAGYRVTALQHQAAEGRFVAESTISGKFVINRAYFPGWRYFVNDREVTPRIVHGLPELMLDAGQSVIEARFTDTPVRTLGNMVSFASLFMCGVLLYEQQRKAKR